MVDKKLSFSEIKATFAEQGIRIEDIAYGDFGDDIVGPSKEVPFHFLT